MTSTARARFLALFAGFFAILLGGALYIVFWKSSGVPSVGPGRRPISVGEIAGQSVVSQTFHVNAAGMNRITVYPEARSRASAAAVVFEISEIVDEEQTRRLFRIVRPLDEVIVEDAYEIRFPPIRSSTGRRYRLDVRAPNAPRGTELKLRANADAGYEEGQLFVDGKERWGDLVFSVGAEDARLWHDPDRHWPGLGKLLPPPGVLTGALVAYAAMLAALFATLASAALETSARGTTAFWIVPGWRRLSLVVLPVVASISVWLGTRRHDIDLIARFPLADKKTSWKHLHGPFSVQTVRVGSGEMKRSIYALPTSRIGWRVDVPDEATFIAYAGMREEAARFEGDGATFVVEIAEQGVAREVFRQHLDPFRRPEHRHWVPVQVDLKDYAGKTIEIVLRTGPGPAGNAVMDASAWGEPHIK